MPFRPENRHTTLSLLAIIVGIFLVGAGLLFFLAEREDDRQDARTLLREQADREYADCLTEFAADLVTTIETRTDASARLERVESRLEAASAGKDRALDRLLFVTELARRTPPEATEQQFDAALAARVRAQEQYDAVTGRLEEAQERLAQVREDNEYVSPEVVCTR